MFRKKNFGFNGFLILKLIKFYCVHVYILIVEYEMQITDIFKKKFFIYFKLISQQKSLEKLRNKRLC